jgi:hypothetical protein
MIAKLLYLPVVAAAALLASSSAFPSSIPFDRTPALSVSRIQPSVAVSSTRSEFDREQAMSPAQLIERWSPFIKEASHRFGVSEDWIRAVMRMESGGRTLLDDKKPITSDAGAVGIMQVMPDTYQEMRHQYGLGANPYEPRDNVLAGTAYLGWLYGKYGYPKLFAAYNAGPGTLEAQFAGARKMPDETRAYVSGIAHILGTEFPPPQSTSTPSQPATVLVTLTRPDGSPVSIDGPTVDSIRASLPNEYAPGVQTVVIMGIRQQGVREDLATVTSALKRPGGKV